MNNEIELINASLRGDKNSFGMIVNRYKSLICAITYNSTGNISASEDIAQETFITAWKNLKNLKDKNKFKSWLLGIARNLTSNHIRRKYQNGSAKTISLNHIQKEPIYAANPRDIAISKEEETLLWRTLEEIPETYREPLILYYRENQSIKSVAEILDLTEDTVKQRLSRGRNMLRIQMAEFVEQTLKKTGPKENFAIGVLVALPALAPHAATGGLLLGATKSSGTVGSVISFSSISAFLGPILGILGGIIGTIASIVNTKSVRERRFMKKSVFVMVGFISIYIGIVAYLIPRFPSHRLEIYIFTSILYVIILLGLIYWTNKRQKEIQIEDGTYEELKPFQFAPSEMSKGAIYGSMAGAVFGSITWIIAMSIIVNDFGTLTLTLIASIFLYLISCKKSLDNPKDYWRILNKVLLGIGLINLVVINLRWTDWMIIYRQSSFYDRSSDLSVLIMNILVISMLLFLFGLFTFISAKQNRKK